jgi:hypothetical protein
MQVDKSLKVLRFVQRHFGDLAKRVGESVNRARRETARPAAVSITGIG